jgi:hypothetical protein
MSQNTIQNRGDISKYILFILVLMIFKSALFATTIPTRENVAKLYVATFNRAPDSLGLDYWVDGSGLNLEEIAQSFFDQTETKQTYPDNTTYSEFVQSVYQNLFNREADKAGEDYWVSELNKGSFSKNSFILAVINGALDSEDGNDATTLDNKTDVGLAFADAGLSDIEDASNIMVGVTDDEQTVTQALTNYNITNDDEANSQEESSLFLTYKVVDTNQQKCFSSSSGSEIECLDVGYDADYSTNTPSYTINGDETVTDNISTLSWQQTSDTNGDGVIDVDDKMSQSDAISYCSSLSLGGYDDWRLPDIKSMYSLIDFSGKDVSGYDTTDTSSLTPFIDTNVFEFGYGDTNADERIIDAQWATTTNYVSTTMNGDETMFGVNLADGRIKGYPLEMQGSDKLFYVQCIRGNEDYGQNNFTDNGDDTITDNATGLMWQKYDNAQAVSFDDAISYCESSTTAGYSDWKLPDAKELQSIVDYTRSPDTTSSAAIDEIFNATQITNEEGYADYGFYWSSTTHENMTDGSSAVYVSFGRALGYMNGEWLDVHGAGAQRSDPKDIDALNTNDPAYVIVDGAITHGPQGDVVRGLNFARCVR